MYNTVGTSNLKLVAGFVKIIEASINNLGRLKSLRNLHSKRRRWVMFDFSMKSFINPGFYSSKGGRHRWLFLRFIESFLCGCIKASLVRQT